MNEMRVARRTRKAGSVPFLLALAAAAGCASGGGPAEEVTAEARLMVEVVNQTPFDVTLYVGNAAGANRRLGTLGSQVSRTYEVPRSVVTWFEEIFLYANPVGADQRRDFRTRPVRVSPGQSLYWQIQTNQRMSNIIVRGARTEPPPE